MHVAAAAGSQSYAGPSSRKVVGLGSCALDYLAAVARYPKPDEKMRTEQLETQGGGNCGNALTAVARLGLSAVIISKIGDDAIGTGIISEFHADGVDTSFLLRHPNSPSPFTYIIVDRAGGTRTCIHTPGAPMLPEELTDAAIQAALGGASIVYFDGRLTDVALRLARAARTQGIPVLVEAERLRPGLESLLGEADYVVTSAHFPQDFTGEATLGDAILATWLRLPRAKFVLTTLGTRGSVLLEAPPAEQSAAGGGGTTCSDAGARPLEVVMDELRSRLPPSDAAAEPACTSHSGIAIGAGTAAQTSGAVALSFSPGRDPAFAASAANAAASQAAALNADAANARGYAAAAAAAAGIPEREPAAHVTLATIASLPKEAVVDTTGAGDSFIGSVLYSLAMGLSRLDMLRLASVVAACKCTALGARQGLPRRTNLHPQLLGPDL